MASKWFYARDGRKSGPISSAELKSLAASGKLRRTDLLWKEGMADWRPADQFPKLFPAEAAASVIVVPEGPAEPLRASLKFDAAPAGKKGSQAKTAASVTENLSSLKVDVAAAGQKAASTVKSHTLTAGKVAALSAERAKISTVTLPIAYAELGEHCYRSRTHAEEFAELFTKLDAVSAGIAASEQPTEAGGDTIAEKAKAWAEQGMKFAQSQAQGVQAKTLFVQLGKACFNRFGPESGPGEFVTRIQALRDRLSKLDAEIKTGVKKTGGAKGWLMYGGGTLVCLMMISSCFSDKDAGGGGAKVGDGASGGSGGIAIQPLARDLPSDPEMRDIYENGWERGAEYGNQWLSAMRGHANGQPLQAYAREHSWVEEKKEDVLARRISSIQNTQMTVQGLIRENADPLVIKRVASQIHDAQGFHDGFKAVSEAGLDGKDTSNATTKRTETTTLTVGEARRLIQRDSWLTIKNPTVISDEVAKVLAQFPLGLDLVGVTTLSDSAIEILAQKPAGHLRLGGLKSLSDRAAKALSQNRSPVMVLDSVPTISDKAAALLAQHPGSVLSLGGLTKLSAQAAKALSAYEGDLHLDGLTALTPEMAKILAQHRGGLSLKGAATLSSEVAESLAQYKGALYLDGLTTLSRDAAKEFAGSEVALSLNGLTTLSPEAAEPLVQITGELSLNGLATPSLELATVLARHQSRLSLQGLKIDKLPEKVKDTLRRHRRLGLPDNRLSL
jgi:hypothetical protein